MMRVLSVKLFWAYTLAVMNFHNLMLSSEKHVWQHPQGSRQKQAVGHAGELVQSDSRRSQQGGAVVLCGLGRL